MLTPHYDILDWIQPDWVIDTKTRTFERGVPRQRPTIELTIWKVDQSYWKYFKPHYYLDLPMPWLGSISSGPWTGSWLATWRWLPGLRCGATGALAWLLCRNGRGRVSVCGFLIGWPSTTSRAAVVAGISTRFISTQVIPRCALLFAGARSGHSALLCFTAGTRRSQRRPSRTPECGTAKRASAPATGPFPGGAGLQVCGEAE